MGVIPLSRQFGDIENGNKDVLTKITYSMIQICIGCAFNFKDISGRALCYGNEPINPLVVGLSDVSRCNGTRDNRKRFVLSGQIVRTSILSCIPFPSLMAPPLTREASLPYIDQF